MNAIIGLNGIALNAHLGKPVEPDALFETLERLIRE